MDEPMTEPSPKTHAPTPSSELSTRQAVATLFPNTRRANAIGLAVLLLAGTAAAFTPPFLATRKVKQFCSQAAVGTPRAELQEKAEVANYHVESLSNGSLLVEPTGSLGRAYCIMRFDDNGALKSTTLGD
jgi:hypothetical protein